jgi:diguanylate cyclase (GGDEF) domain
MLIVILIKNITDKDNDSFQNKIFTMIIQFTLYVLTSEAIGWAFDGKSGMYSHIIVTLSDMIEMVLVLIPGILWMIYADYFIYNNMLRIKKITIISKIMLTYFTFLSVTAPFNKLLFYIDSANIYHRGSWYWQSQFVSFAFFIYVFIILLWSRKRISNDVFIPMMLFPVPPLIGILLQMFFYGLSSAWSGISISILIIYVYIQNQKSSIDYLTGLYNRRQLDLYLENNIKGRPVNKIVLLMMIDVDKFKEINDTWGHEMGDKALKHCAAILRKCFHHRDFIARYAGDEFVVVLELDNSNDVHKIIERLKDTVETTNNTGDIPYKLSFSVGYALFPDDGQDASQILQKADERMYMEKSRIKS